MHVPPWLMEDDGFRLALEAELESAFRPEGEPTHEKAILIKPADYASGKLRYMLKGIARRDAAQLGVRKTRFEGEIVGKRVGSTQNIGSAARKQHHWIRPQISLNAKADAKNIRQNASSGAAQFEGKSSKFEGGIRYTNLALRQQVTVGEEFGTRSVAASRSLIATVATRTGD